MDLFVELSLIIVVAVIITSIVRLLRQPVIIGYILTGIILSPHFLNLIKSTESMYIFSQIGIALLLFIVGLNLSPKVIKEVGMVSLITGVGQVLFTSLIGFFIGRFFGFSVVTSLYIAVALTFSSTIIIMKLLSDKNALNTLYGKISIGFLLVQDIIVVFILIFVSSLSNGANTFSLLTVIILKGILLAAVLIPVSIYVLPKLCNFFAKSQELLFLFSVGWGLGLAVLFYYFGFSIEIGALSAGILLSILPYRYEISSKMKPLRDFFIILFFILLGSQMTFGDIGLYIFPIIVFSLFILIGNPLIVLILMGLLKYTKRTSFLAGLTVAQISEFSLILIALGVKLGHLSTDILSMVTVIGLITIAGSTYFILYADKVYPYISSFLTIFERKGVRERKRKTNNYSAILFGYNRIGYDILSAFKKLKKKFLVVDYNPDTIKTLNESGLNCVYGDANDSELLDELNLKGIKMVISTVPEFETNLVLLNKVRRVNKNAIVILVSHQINEAHIFYKNGASYVLMPHFLGGHYASHMIIKHGFNKKKFLSEKRKHITNLKKRRKIGHEHPKVEKHR